MKTNFSTAIILVCISLLLQNRCYAQASADANSQKLKVSVTSEGEPLGYAYLFINEQIFGSVDSMGITYVPKNHLKTGDTISASFVGTEPAFVIYDGALAARQSLTLDLVSNTDIDEVVVTAKDRSMALFRKYVNPKTTLVNFTKYHINYKISIDGGSDITGNFTYNQLPRSYSEITGEKYITDYKNISPELIMDVVNISGGAKSAASMRRGDFFNEDFIIKYRGKSDGRHLFLVIRPFLNNNKNMESNQTLLYVDANTKEIVVVQSDRVYNNGNKISLSATFKLHGKGQLEMLYPDKASGTIVKRENGKEQTVHVEITNVTVEPYKRTHIPKSKREEYYKNKSNETL